MYLCVPTIEIWIPLPKGGDCGDSGNYSSCGRASAEVMCRSPDTRDGVMSCKYGQQAHYR